MEQGDTYTTNAVHLKLIDVGSGGEAHAPIVLQFLYAFPQHRLIWRVGPGLTSAAVPDHGNLTQNVRSEHLVIFGSLKPGERSKALYYVLFLFRPFFLSSLHL